MEEELPLAPAGNAAGATRPRTTTSNFDVRCVLFVVLRHGGHFRAPGPPEIDPGRKVASGGPQEGSGDQF